MSRVRILPGAHCRAHKTAGRTSSEPVSA